jgi:hypothetical protein
MLALICIINFPLETFLLIGAGVSGFFAISKGITAAGIICAACIIGFVIAVIKRNENKKDEKIKNPNDES